MFRAAFTDAVNQRALQRAILCLQQAHEDSLRGP